MSPRSGAEPAAPAVAPASRTFPAHLDILAFLGQTGPSEPRPRFGDDRWDLGALDTIPAYARTPGRTRLEWSRIADERWRLCAKEVGLALLAPRVGLAWRLAGARRRPVGVGDLSRYLGMWQRWFAWLADHGLNGLGQLTQAHCDAWLAGRLQEVSRSTVVAEITALRHFATYAPLLSADAYPSGFMPWAATSAARVTASHRPGENVTPVIPDEVLGPLLGACLFLVTVAGPDVVAARAEWRRLGAPQPPDLGAGDLDQRLEAYLAALAAAGRGLPELHRAHLAHRQGRGSRPEGEVLAGINLRLIERHIGAYNGALARGGRRRRLEAARAELGSSPGGLDTPATAVADPTDPTTTRAWHGGFSPYELEDLAAVVVTGCYVVVAALSGLRASELAEMRRGCVRTEGLGGGLQRHRIHTTQIKGQPPGGAPGRWTVIAEVAQAFALVERLIDDDAPFARLAFRRRYGALLRWINTQGPRAYLSPVPEHWRPTARQFRRTLARQLGFRPHGVLAGKVHLKHVSVATSEGYFGRPGSSAAAFLAEVERERARARLGTIKALYRDWAAGAPMAGAGRAELAGLFAAVRAELGDAPAALVVDDARLEALLGRRADSLHVGVLNHCWFVDPARARCLQKAAGPGAAVAGTAPLVAHCEPTRCANATIHPVHVPVWLDTRRHLDALVASARVPSQEKQRLGAERARLDAVIDAAAAPAAPEDKEAIAP